MPCSRVRDNNAASSPNSCLDLCLFILSSDV
jgi:hypothetical protein